MFHKLSHRRHPYKDVAHNCMRRYGDIVKITCHDTTLACPGGTLSCHHGNPIATSDDIDGIITNLSLQCLMDIALFVVT